MVGYHHMGRLLHPMLCAPHHGRRGGLQKGLDLPWSLSLPVHLGQCSKLPRMQQEILVGTPLIHSSIQWDVTQRALNRALDVVRHVTTVKAKETPRESIGRLWPNRRQSSHLVLMLYQASTGFTQLRGGRFHVPHSMTLLDQAPNFLCQ